MEDAYNGWKNRSTWLAIVHLANTNEEVYKDTMELAKTHKAVQDEHNAYKKQNPTSISYPYHQDARDRKVFNGLLGRTTIADEYDYVRAEIDTEQVLGYFLDV